MFILGYVCLSTGRVPRSTLDRRGTYPGQRTSCTYPGHGPGVPTLDGGTYHLPWTGGTHHGQGVPSLDGGYLNWMGDTYLGWGVPTLDGGGYLR